MTCTDCPAFKICPEKPVREDYEDENKYLIDLECGVWSCQKTILKLCKEIKQLKAQIKKLKEGKQYETCPYRATDMGCDYYRDRDLKDEM